MGLIGLVVSCGFTMFFGLLLLATLRDGATSMIVVGMGAVFCIPFVAMLVGGFLIVRSSNEKRAQNLRIRQSTIEELRPELMSEVHYVGGHPLIPQVSRVVLALEKPVVKIYQLNSNYELGFITSIDLLEVSKVRMGRPKSAQEVYDEDSGYSLDVYEQSPFLNIIFRLDGHSYQVTFDDFEKPYSPRDWYNRLIAVQHDLRSGL